MKALPASAASLRTRAVREGEAGKGGRVRLGEVEPALAGFAQGGGIALLVNGDPLLVTGRTVVQALAPDTRCVRVLHAVQTVGHQRWRAVELADGPLQGGGGLVVRGLNLEQAGGARRAAVQHSMGQDIALSGDEGETGMMHGQLGCRPKVLH